jgi:hypothetical protein
VSRYRLVVASLFVIACSNESTPLPGPDGVDARATADGPAPDTATSRDTARSPDTSGADAADLPGVDAGAADTAGVDGPATVDAAAGADAPAVDGSGDAGAVDRVDLGTDLAADAGGDLPADTGPAAAAFESYLRDWEAAYAARLVACFHASAEAIAAGPTPETPELGRSLRLGLATFDATAAAACLAAVRAGSCEEILALGYAEGDGWHVAFPACKGVITGHVTSGAPCFAATDCTVPGETCFGDVACGGPTCVADLPPPPLGAPCENQRCAPDAVCGPNPLPDGPEQCHLRGGDGAACDADGSCATGFYCAFAGLNDGLGICRAVKPGGACSGSWGCPRLLACIGAGAGKMGTCQAGRGAGEVCTLQGVDQNGRVFHECAASLVCADSNGSGPHCVAGSRLGGRCGALPVTGDILALVPCLEGFCDDAASTTDPKSGTCRALRARDAGCMADRECAAGLVCGRTAPAAADTCLPPAPPVPIGSTCVPAAEGCVEGAFCRPAGEGAESGTCQPLRKTGETCIEGVDQCELLNSCQEGVCTRC